MCCVVCDIEHSALKCCSRSLSTFVCSIRSRRRSCSLLHTIHCNASHSYSHHAFAIRIHTYTHTRTRSHKHMHMLTLSRSLIFGFLYCVAQVSSFLALFLMCFSVSFTTIRRENEEQELSYTYLMRICFSRVVTSDDMLAQRM